MYRVALIGMPGSGKSTVGRALAERLGLPFIDLDKRIEQTEGTSISTIFKVQGEAGFRQMETDALDQACEQFREGGVCATGGGVVVSATNRQRLKQDWTAVYLEASIETLAERLHTERDVRPLLAGDGEQALIERLRLLYMQRGDWYSETAAHRVVVDGRSNANIVEAIVERLVQPSGGRDFA